ncbi:hypothetical protein BDN70DRAFT_900479 [Pholiota conissans]|uniref:Uncharacterized protein n=1 Tax=Pholiota conissans TaxID=109636 RepID=A0A9P5YRD6_9AGAR|nr:hypothetical protein BDN70DRAFT_900479 [Pholiota conissans]
MSFKLQGEGKPTKALHEEPGHWVEEAGKHLGSYPVAIWSCFMALLGGHAVGRQEGYFDARLSRLMLLRAVYARMGWREVLGAVDGGGGRARARGCCITHANNAAFDARGLALAAARAWRYFRAGKKWAGEWGDASATFWMTFGYYYRFWNYLAYYGVALHFAAFRQGMIVKKCILQPEGSERERRGRARCPSPIVPLVIALGAVSTLHYPHPLLQFPAPWSTLERCPTHYPFSSPSALSSVAVRQVSTRKGGVVVCKKNRNGQHEGREMRGTRPTLSHPPFLPPHARLPARVPHMHSSFIPHWRGGGDGCHCRCLRRSLLTVHPSFSLSVVLAVRCIRHLSLAARPWLVVCRVSFVSSSGVVADSAGHIPQDEGSSTRPGMDADGGEVVVEDQDQPSLTWLIWSFGDFRTSLIGWENRAASSIFVVVVDDIEIGMDSRAIRKITT